MGDAIQMNATVMLLVVVLLGFFLASAEEYYYVSVLACCGLLYLSILYYKGAKELKNICHLKKNFTH
jgi:Ca2+/Na+ antiporter